ncbi:MAG: hypothetical protein NT076_03115 [Candidatus Pacearchaeota archaeon]|nr:hypothetical protein [Candidatus Pacearchaeota archaeon]
MQETFQGICDKCYKRNCPLLDCPENCALYLLTREIGYRQAVVEILFRANGLARLLVAGYLGLTIRLEEN